MHMKKYKLAIKKTYKEDNKDLFKSKDNHVIAVSESIHYHIYALSRRKASI